MWMMMMMEYDEDDDDDEGWCGWWWGWSLPSSARTLAKPQQDSLQTSKIHLSLFVVVLITVITFWFLVGDNLIVEPDSNQNDDRELLYSRLAMVSLYSGPNDYHWWYIFFRPARWLINMSRADIPGSLHHSKNQPLKYLSEYSANRYSVEEVKDLFLPKKSFQREREVFFPTDPRLPINRLRQLFKERTTHCFTRSQHPTVSPPVCRKIFPRAVASPIWRSGTWYMFQLFHIHVDLTYNVHCQ